MKSLNDYIATYKVLLEQGDIQIAYESLCRYMMSLKTHFSKACTDRYSVGKISPGYMDFTYFPFVDDSLRKKKLRFGIVLNYRKLQFELWLMGQNSEVQMYYWRLLQNAKWNKDRLVMPPYAVIEVVLVQNPDFNNLNLLTDVLTDRTLSAAEEIQDFLTEIRLPF